MCDKDIKIMVKLSVNINKIATIRNSRGGDTPNVVQAAIRCEEFGAQGITVHPRPDGRHIRYSDVLDLAKVITTEFNIEGYPTDDFVDLVLSVRPTQVTLVPDPPTALTSNAGWNTIANREFLSDVVARFHSVGIRTSIFVEPSVEMVRAAKLTSTDRIELYTESYAIGYMTDPAAAIAPFVEAANAALECGLGVNAGHDLSLENLEYFARHIPALLEVSIGHALISDALYLGLENTVQLYRRCL